MRAILWSLLLSWKVFHAIFMWELKLQIPFLSINDNTFSSQKVLLRIIGLWLLPSMSIIIKSTGTKVICNSTRTLLTIQKALLIDQSSSFKSISNFSIGYKSR
jgi:hypothetical protein